MKRFLALFLSVLMIVSLVACGGSNSTQPGESKADSGQSEKPAGGKILRIAESFAYPSLDAHADYYGWYTSIYGVTETLYRIGDDSQAHPCLAESITPSADGKVWTIKLNAKAAFSNGQPLTADMAIRNIERLAEKNERFAYLKDFKLAKVDDKSFTITTEQVYPTMISDLASPEMAMMDLDNTKDFVNAPIGTGPFVVKSFEPEGKVEVSRNEKYWNGEVKLDGAIIYHMADDDSKLMAMQNGEIDAYGSVTAAAIEVFKADPKQYKLTVVPATRLQFYVLNENRLDANVRKAINLIVNPEAMAAFLKGTVSPAIGPFSPDAAYGKVSKPKPNPAEAKAILEKDGYKLNQKGIYEKDGKELNLNLCYYAARSLDTLAVLMEEEFKKAGVAVTLTLVEDPDATYMKTGDYDIALYCMIADKAGDPWSFIKSTLKEDSRYKIAGFHNEQMNILIDKLMYETDVQKRAELANNIIQIAIDDNAFGYVGLFNKTTVLRQNVSNLSEKCPFDFYRLTADSDIQ